MSLAATLFSDYRRPVLGLLLMHPDARYHLREVARLTGTQPTTLTREMKKLVEAGLLTKQGIGQQVFYSANRDCPVFEEMASILRKTSGLVDVLAETLLPLAAQIETAFVFGSAASGKATSGSDIDLMVIGNASFTEVVAALYPAQEALDREINPNVYQTDEWRSLIKENGSFARDVLAKSRLMVMRGMDNLKKS